MQLTHIVLLTLAVAGVLMASYFAVKRRALPNVQSAYPDASLVGACAASAVLVALLCVRSLGFGVDTVAYAELFTHYCNGGRLSDVEGSFQAATLLLNSLMGGACSTGLLPAAWIAAIVIPVFAMAAPPQVKIYFLAAFLLSIVGIELATNALRQGLSGGLLLLGISIHWTQRGPRRLWALPACLMAAVFHSSAVLFLAAYGLAHLGWKWFLTVTLALVWVTLASMDAQVAVPLASDFLYEIQKYAAHEDDEFWVRVLAFACVLAALAAPLLARQSGRHRSLPQPQRRGRAYSVAIRLALLCLPFLALPYFGYRFIYGVYPAILFLSLWASVGPEASPGGLGRQFSWLLTLNVLILLAWSAGSSYMREVPFL